MFHVKHPSGGVRTAAAWPASPWRRGTHSGHGATFRARHVGRAVDEDPATRRSPSRSRPVADQRSGAASGGSLTTTRPPTAASAEAHSAVTAGGPNPRAVTTAKASRRSARRPASSARARTTATRLGQGQLAPPPGRGSGCGRRGRRATPSDCAGWLMARTRPGQTAAGAEVERRTGPVVDHPAHGPGVGDLAPRSRLGPGSRRPGRPPGSRWQVGGADRPPGSPGSGVSCGERARPDDEAPRLRRGWPRRPPRPRRRGRSCGRGTTSAPGPSGVPDSRTSVATERANRANASRRRSR